MLSRTLWRKLITSKNINNKLKMLSEQNGGACAKIVEDRIYGTSNIIKIASHAICPTFITFLKSFFALEKPKN